MKKYMFIVRRVEGRSNTVVNGEVYKTYNKAMASMEHEAAAHNCGYLSAERHPMCEDQFILKENGVIIGQLYIEALNIG